MCVCSGEWFPEVPTSRFRSPCVLRVRRPFRQQARLRPHRDGYPGASGVVALGALDALIGCLGCLGSYGYCKKSNSKASAILSQPNGLTVHFHILSCSHAKGLLQGNVSKAMSLTIPNFTTEFPSNPDAAPHLQSSSSLSSSSSSSSSVSTHVELVDVNRYNQLLCLVFKRDHKSATSFDKDVEWCNHINLSS